MRTKEEAVENSKVFDLDIAIIQKYVQFGDSFNLLHAAASYLRVYQGGFGAVGVSNKYGKRSFARYPIFVRSFFLHPPLSHTYFVTADACEVGFEANWAITKPGPERHRTLESNRGEAAY